MIGIWFQIPTFVLKLPVRINDMRNVVLNKIRTYKSQKNIKRIISNYLMQQLI